MKILITGGGTEEPIDSVRSVCNVSTGQTAAFLAEHFLRQGHDVTAIMARRAVLPSARGSENGTLSIRGYKTFAELHAVLEDECRNGGFRAVIHAAAVSDYSPDTVEIDGKEFKAGEILKLPSDGELVVRMRKNPKLLGFLREWTGGAASIVAFKLTSGASAPLREAAVERLFRAGGPDAVVANDLAEISGESHPCTIHQKNGRKTPCRTLSDLAAALEALILKAAEEES